MLRRSFFRTAIAGIASFFGINIKDQFNEEDFSGHYHTGGHNKMMSVDFPSRYWNRSAILIRMAEYLKTRCDEDNLNLKDYRLVMAIEPLNKEE